MDSRTSLKIRCLSVLSLFVVVLQHSSVAVGGGIPNILWRNIVTDGIADYPVSFFFILSGFFLAQHREEGWYRNAVLKRIKSLVIPYFLWCIIGWGFFEGFQLKQLLDSLGLSRHLPVLSSLWYIKVLFLLVMFSPMLILCERWLCFSDEVKMMVFLISYVFMSMLCLFFEIPAQKTVVFSTFYFCFGLMIARIDWRPGIRLSMLVIMLIMCILVVLKITCVFLFDVKETFLRWFFCPVSIIAAWRLYDIVDARIRITDLCQKSRCITKLFSGTFFLYCVQDFVMKAFRLGSTKLGVTGFGYSSSGIGAVFFAVIVMFCSVFLMLFVSSCFPRSFCLFNGGR